MRASAPGGAALLDTRRFVATPEGIELTLRLAGPVARALAWAIDFLLRLGVLIVLSIVAAPLGGVGTAILLLTWFALEWLAPAWFEVYWQGATPGKRALGLAVVHDDGRPVRWPAALTRNLLRAVDFLPLFYGFGLIAVLASRDFKRLGDLAAGTVVIHRDRPPGMRRLPEAAPIAPGVALTADESRAILEFAERMQGLTAERAAELAAAAGALVAEHPDPTQRLVGIANHLSGARRAEREAPP